MPISIDNLINVNFIKGDIDLLKFGLMLGGKGQHKPYIFKPEDLFFLGEKGAYYSPSDLPTLFQDAAGTTAVTADGDPVGLAVDKSGNAVNAAQSVSASRPVYNVSPSRLSLDKVDDALVITVPAGGWIGTMVLATDQGTASYGVSIPAGAYNLGGVYFPGDAIVGVVFRDGALSAGEKAGAEAYFVGSGAVASYGAVSNFYSFWKSHSEITEFPSIDTSSGENFAHAWQGCSSIDSFPSINTSSGGDFAYAWRDCSSLTSFPLIGTSKGTNFSAAWDGCSSLDSFPLIDTSGGENFSYTWRSCSSLTSFPLINTSSGTAFREAWRFCSSLTSFPANAFDYIKGGDFTYAFDNTALNQTSIDGILVSLATSGIAAGTRVFDQSGGSAPSVATGRPAIVTLRSRGWTVHVEGGY